MNTALAREIPTEEDQVADLKASLFKLSDSADIPELKKNAFQYIALQLGDLSNFYAEPERLRDLPNHRYRS